MTCNKTMALSRPANLHRLQTTHDLCVACSRCCKRRADISYYIVPVVHRCSKDIILARKKGNNITWRPVAQRPKFPQPVKYEVCWHYIEGKGCTSHGDRCSFARSTEEAEVWNFMKRDCIEFTQLTNMLPSGETYSNAQENLAPSSGSSSAVHEMLSSFQGTFVELCKTCFHDSPQKISSRMQGKFCTGHSWRPTLVFCQKGEQSRVVYDEIRALPQRTYKEWRYCKYVKNNENCLHGANRCCFAHSSIEKTVWELETTGSLDRTHLLQASQQPQPQSSGASSRPASQKQGRQQSPAWQKQERQHSPAWQKQERQHSPASQEQERQHYCHVCGCQFKTSEDFMNHCFTIKHRELVFGDMPSAWRCRDPPQTSKVFQMCERRTTCEYGDSCMNAHSMEELQEWRKRHKFAQKKLKAVKEQGILSYQDCLLEEYKQSPDKGMIMMESVPYASVSCDSDLSTFVRQEKISHIWKFTITSEEALDVVALLRQDIGAKFFLGKDPSEERSYSAGIWFLHSTDNKYVYEIIVSFTSDRLGLYEQWLVFDFDRRPVLLQKLQVRVGEAFRHLETPSSCALEEEKARQNEEVWHDGNVEIVPFVERTVEEKELLRRYRPTMRHLNNGTTGLGSINHQNYKEKMHSFLYREEIKEDQLVRRLNLRGMMSLKIYLHQWFETKFAIPGELFGSVPIAQSLTLDTPEGYMLKRHVQSALVGLPQPADGPQRVYEVAVLKDMVGETEVNLTLSGRCCTELNLKSETTVEMEIQFQLDRIGFCDMHKAVDFLPDLSRVLPDLTDRNAPVPIKSSPGELNEKQQAAMDFILETSGQRGNTAPLLIYGPFGTGKTFTLAKITLALAKKPHNKILICTHTNSSADLYVKDHFHSSVSIADHALRPLRIKAKEIPLRTTHSDTLQYCHLSKDGYSFDFPDVATMDAKRIIITTTTLARFFHDMQLPPNYFSHILIDEASQMLECEALMALGLAGEKTQVVLAGDHMQMGPRLFSVEEDKRSDHTILNRLFHYYQSENTTTAKNRRIIFNENYRSTEEIVDFVSTHFYVGKKDVIKAKGNVSPHPDQCALQFVHVRGECHLDSMSLTWFNPVQIQSVVDIVQNVLNEWPEKWQQPDPTSICVVSQGCQVTEIRKRLRQPEVALRMVTVENAENVQGKQFRVIIINTVHTKDSLNVTEETYLEFFNDMRLLNTVMTRAQSQVIVVGDAAALCCSYFGKCWRLWRSYIEHCINKGSIYPQDFTSNILKQELLELSNMIKTEEDDSSDDESTTSEPSDTDEDPILKELLDEHDLQINLTEEGLFPVLQSDNLDKNLVRYMRRSESPEPHGAQQNNSDIYKCEIILERYDSGYAKPLDKPTLRIDIKGRQNLRQSFSGDVVNVEILTSETFPPKGRVIEVLKHAAVTKEFVCTIDNNDDQVMTPINICIPKLFTPFWKDKPNQIAIRNPEKRNAEKFIRINENARRNNLFVVKFLKWGERFNYPLGMVINVLPKVTSLEDGLKVLDKEYQLKRPVPLPVLKEMENFKKTPLLANGRKDFRDLLTFTIDAPKSQDLDDAISVRDLGHCYEIGIHIADVASFVDKDSELDKYARQQGTAFYVSEADPTYMFPEKLSTKDFSLLPECERRCISLMTEVDKETHRIQKRTFFKSVICSKKRLSYEEAEEILRTSGNDDFGTVEGCLVKASQFAEVHRKCRKLGDWCYKSPDEDVVIGRRQSHKLVEELMIMFNHTVADRLLSEKKTMSLTPLRCQDRPNQDELQKFFDRNVPMLPMSIHLSSQLNHNEQNDGTEQEKSFPILTSVLRNLEIAAQEKDIYKLVDLITTDDLHPLLLPLVINLRRLLYKSHVLRANSTHLSRIGHYDLELDCYTWASSPIRRYVDVIVQRLLHSVLEDDRVPYTSHEVDQCCVDFTLKNSNQSACQKKSYSLSLASKLSGQNEEKLAYVVEVSPNGNNFQISFPLNRTSLPDTVSIMYRDLQLEDQPRYFEATHCMVLRWKRRVYSFSSPSIHTELKRQEANSRGQFITHVPLESWKRLVSAIRKEEWDIMVQEVEQLSCTALRTNTNVQPAIASKMEMLNPGEEHYIELSLELKKGKMIEVQLGTDTSRGLLVPSVQLLVVNPKFEICLEHTKNPIVCFSKYALFSSRKSYTSYMEYQRIWKPLCEMESACSAVAENESIVIEDALLQWNKSQDDLKGSFRLPIDKKAQWAIEANLRNCFLCIRMRMQQKDRNPILEDSDSQDMDLVDVPGFIWIAHAVVTKVTGEEESKKLTYTEINFRVNHRPMTNIPEMVYMKGARFTVELIPKLLPDVRKENAIENLTSANNLVKNIAMGKKTQDEKNTIQNCNQPRFEIENHRSLRFPHLNNSQCKAIREAMNNEFTLIQGPPGTGKTVVGVHIVYWFFKQNQKLPPCPKLGDEDPKKRCILYCGPSNKSVDVVAGQLLTLKQKLKPLRIYSDQMEIMEFPYPGSILRISRHCQRVEKPNKALRSITLHYKIREKTNPYHEQILEFDGRIRTGQYLTDKEIKSYKDCLRKARKHELLQHDVILCTCTAASHPILADVLNFQQIIIDECAMATEPEAFIPLVTHKPKQIVLLGDHKQLQPVVHTDLLQRLGLRKSLFERYTNKALMLDTQYRMQKDICAFPSEEFYKGKLKTGIPDRMSVFLNIYQNPTSILFGHVEGKELSLVVSTERGNENSKANIEEAEAAVRLAKNLIKSGIKPKEIAILTPYNAQVNEISTVLTKYGINNVTVNTIMKSQGSEWKYVILSTVRSFPMTDIEMQPTKAWLKKRLGFVMDPHQVNVGITRAQEGLCLIGNKNLLHCCYLWRRLLKHYEEKGCVVDPAWKIQCTLA